MTTQIPEPLGDISETIDELEVPSSTLLDAVIELCEESTSKDLESMSAEVMRLPTFAEQSFTEHKIDLAPHDHGRREREIAMRDEGDWTGLAQLLLERAELTTSRREAASVLVEVATIYWDQLKNGSAAQAILAKALEVDPSCTEAADDLERVSSSVGQWVELMGAFKRAADELSESEPAASGELWIRLATAYLIGRGDVARAFASVIHARAGDPSRVEAHLSQLERAIGDKKHLESMIAVSHRIGDSERSARLLSKAIAMSQSVVERAYYHHSIALIEMARSENDAAEWHFREALRLDPAHHEARDALGNLYRDNGQFRKAVELLEEARACTADAQRKAHYALEAAQIYSDRLGENTKAVDLYEAALRIQPNSLQASLPVVERYYQQGRWSELASVLDSLLSKEASASLHSSERSELYLMAGTAALKLERYEKARDMFKECSEHSGNRLDAALGGARACIALDSNVDALGFIEKAMALHERLGHAPEEMVATLSLSAKANLKVGNGERALSHLKICAELGDSEAMGDLADLYAMRGDHHAAVKMNLSRADKLEPAERVAVLCEVSDLLYETIGDTEAAIDVCWQALSVDKEAREALHRLAVIYSKTEQWRDAIKTIVRMASLEAGAVRRARYLQAAGTIACQENQIVEAVALLNKAIAAYAVDSVMSVEAPTRASTFECFRLIIDVLSKAKDWRGVEENYRKMICRLEPGDPDVGGLWKSLGEVYRDKLDERSAAIDSYEVASSLDVGGLTNHRVLVDLYEGAGSDQLEKAIERRRFLLEAEPHVAEHYKALRGLYVRTRQMDRVWCVCRALDHLGIADNRELGFYRRNLPSNMVWPTRSMNSEMWSRVRDSEVDPNVSRIFGLVSEVIALNDASSPSQVQLGGVPDPQFDHLLGFFSAISYVFGLSGFDCFVQSQKADPVTLVNLRRGTALEPTFVLGRQLYEGRRVEHIVNGLGRFLFYGRRSYYLRLALRQPGQLAAAFHAAVSVVRPNIPLPRGLEPHASRFLAALQAGLHPTWGAKLSQAVDVHLAQNGPGFDVSKWCEGVDATARHAALLLSSDLNTAMAGLKTEPGMSGAKLAAAKQRLLLASVSDAHMSLREDLGISFAK
jgi:tetratricopeptide (TPR) repeat protein